MPFLALSPCECKQSPTFEARPAARAERRATFLQAAPHRLYQASSRCTWHACRVQRQHPTQRGMLTSSGGVPRVQHWIPWECLSRIASCQ
jgi:hypothetical protein